MTTTTNTATIALDDAAMTRHRTITVDARRYDDADDSAGSARLLHDGVGFLTAYNSASSGKRL